MRIANNLKKTLLTAMTFGTALTACNPDEPIPGPEPKPEPKPKTENISIKSMDNIRIVRDMQMNPINTYNAIWANNLGVAPAEHSVIGEVDALAANHDYFNHNRNGKGVYPTDANSVLTAEQWASGNYTDLVPGPNGEKYHVTHDQVAQFEARGETDINKIAKPTQTIELTVADVADFSAAIKRIAAQNPTEAVNICLPRDENGNQIGVDITDDTILSLLSSLHVGDPTKKINIVDKDGQPVDLLISKQYTHTWDSRPGGNARWILASEAAGMKPKLFWDFAEGLKSGQIIFQNNPENTLELTTKSGAKNFTYIELNSKVLPLGYTLNIEGNQYKPPFTLDAGNTCIFIPDVTAGQLGFEPNVYDTNTMKNSLAVFEYLRDKCNILAVNIFNQPDWDWATDINLQYIVIYDTELWSKRMAGRSDGKFPYRADDIYFGQNTRAVAQKCAPPQKSVSAFKSMQNVR